MYTLQFMGFRAGNYLEGFFEVYKLHFGLCYTPHCPGKPLLPYLYLGKELHTHGARKSSEPLGGRRPSHGVKLSTPKQWFAESNVRGYNGAVCKFPGMPFWPQDVSIVPTRDRHLQREQPADVPPAIPANW